LKIEQDKKADEKIAELTIKVEEIKKRKRIIDCLV